MFGVFFLSLPRKLILVRWIDLINGAEVFLPRFIFCYICFMPSRDITLCDIRLQQAWAFAVPEFAKLHPDITPKISCTERTLEEQAELYAIGRTVIGKNPSAKKPLGSTVTNALPGKSPHNYKPAQALDYFFVDAQGKAIWNDYSLYALFAKLMQSFDKTLVWGGNFNGFKDTPHMETPDWRNLTLIV